LKIGDRVVFLDMAHYTMVKTTTFNGVPLPSIAVFDPFAGGLKVVARFGYEDYRRRLG
jgi:carboxynorspermidine decarboxylase